VGHHPAGVLHHHGEELELIGGEVNEVAIDFYLATAEIDSVSAANLERFAIRRIWTRGHYRVPAG